MMALAAAVAPPKDKVSMFRDKAHLIADRWVDSLAAALLDDKPMTMEQISALFEEKRAELMGALVADFIGVHHQEVLEQQIAACPECGKSCKSKRQASRRVDSRQGSSLLALCADSGASRPPIPVESGHPFQCIAATDSI